jgi:all-trans-retinol 13,14-reductase
MNRTTETYDVAIIGSGIGSLACASLIAQLYNKKVIVIEQHSEPGGFSRQISSKSDVPFEVGIHQVGELNPTSLFSKLMTCITNGESAWRKLPETFIKFKFPDFLYEVSAGEINQIARLAEIFPSEEQNIRQYYKDIDNITKWYRSFTTETIARDKDKLQSLLESETGLLAMLTTEAYLDMRFEDPKLRSLLGSHWTDYGLPPALSAFLKHALLVNNHKEGVYYPEYGSKQLIDAIISTITEQGGKCIVNTLVKEIQCNGNVAESMTVLDKNTSEELQIRAGVIISGIGMVNTYTRLFKSELAAEKLEAIKSVKSPGVSFTSLLVTLSANPVSIGADQSLLWVYAGYDHGANFKNRNCLVNSVPSQYSISFPSLKKEQVSPRHSMKINTLVDYTAFKLPEYSSTESYDQLKTEIAQRLLADAEKIYPGLMDIVESWELQTPLDAKHTTQHVNGNIFGMPDTPERYRNLEMNCYTPLDNVFLTGSDITSSGIYAAVLAGAITASAAFKDKEIFIKIMQAAAKRNRMLKAG